MVICLYSGRIATATIDFINIFPFTDVHGSISITPVTPSFNIFPSCHRSRHHHDRKKEQE